MASEQHSSIKLGEALEAVGYRQLAKRARQHEFHDFLSPHALPVHELVAELRELPDSDALIRRAEDGEFDATGAEADEWAGSPEGQAALAVMDASRLAPETGFADENHVLLVGNVLGALLRLKLDASIPTEVEPVLDKGGNYTNRIRVKRNSGAYIVTVEPE